MTYAPTDAMIASLAVHQKRIGELASTRRGRREGMCGQRRGGAIIIQQRLKLLHDYMTVPPSRRDANFVVYWKGGEGRERRIDSESVL